VFEQASVGVLPQGWMRARGKDGVVVPQRWEDADLVLPHAHSVVVSEEDVEPFEKDALEWFQRVPVGVITHGSRGATLFVNGDPYHVEPDTAAALDPTGAGDVFATALLIEYEREGNHWDAAAAAACAAAMSVEAPGAAGTPDRAALDARLRAYRRRQAGG
jgi:sugar/nucleoside kinase (ribokinase family)